MLQETLSKGHQPPDVPLWVIIPLMVAMAVLFWKLGVIVWSYCKTNSRLMNWLSKLEGTHFLVRSFLTSNGY